MKIRDIEFGNQSQCTLLLNTFSEKTTLHGFSHVIKTESSDWKVWIWRILFGVCLFTVSCGIYQIANGYLKEPITLSSSQKLYKDGGNIDPLFPLTDLVRITICKHPSWDPNIEEDAFISKYGFTALGFPFHSLSDAEMDFLHLENENRSVEKYDKFNEAINKYNKLMELGHNATYFIQNRSLSCEKIFGVERCFPNFTTIFTSEGQCYSTLLKESGDAYTLFYPEHRSTDQPEGFQIFISHPLEHTGFLEKGSYIFVPPSSYVNLDIKLILTNREAIYTPWHGFSTDCPSLPKGLEPNETLRKLYNTDACFHRLVLQYTEQLQNCSAILAGLKLFPHVCTPQDMLDGYDQADELISSIYGEKDICAYPCFEYTYDLDWKLTKFGRKNISKLSCYYDQMHFSLHEYKKVSLNGIMGQIGGFLGLYLGASIVTIVELVDFLGRWFWYKLFPHRSAQRVTYQTKLQRFRPWQVSRVRHNKLLAMA